jgi:UV DNA damage repair endonuclease
MDASAEFIYFDLEAQEAPQHPPRVDRRQSPASIDAQRLAHLLTANGRLMALPGEDAADAIEIELDAKQMDVLLEEHWMP